MGSFPYKLEGEEKGGRVLARSSGEYFRGRKRRIRMDERNTEKKRGSRGRMKKKE